MADGPENTTRTKILPGRFQPVGLTGRRAGPISAKLFCKRSQVTFMPYGIVLKDERRTSNIERPTSNEKQTSNTEHSTTPRRGFFSAVLILVTKILINSSVSSKISFSSSGFLKSVSSSFPIQHSMLDVRCSMFIFFSPS